MAIEVPSDLDRPRGLIRVIECLLIQGLSCRRTIRTLWPVFFFHTLAPAELTDPPCSPDRVTPIPSEDLRKLDGWAGSAYSPL